LSHIIDPLGFNGADDSREMLLNCSWLVIRPIAMQKI
jgi:hypothetical protein